MARKLEVEIIGDASSLNREMRKAEKGTAGFEKRLGGIKRAAGFAGVALGGALVVGAKSAADAFYESQKVAKQTEAVLKSTGGAANITAKQVGDLATAISKKTGVDDEAIQSGENLLLTFTKIRNETGRGNDVFNRATSIITDMSVALGQDMKSSAIQVGKALNDPIKGVTALQRVGVSFTASQKEQIKGLVEHGHALDAQKLILRELTAEFGGSAAAQATSMDKLKVTLGNLQESIGAVLVPTLEKAAGAINAFVDQMMSGTGAGGRLIQVLKRLGTFLSDTLTTAVQGVNRWLRRHHDDLEAAAEATRNVGRAMKATWETIVLPIVQRVLPAIKQIVTGAFTAIGGAVDVLAGILTGDFGRAWDGVKAIFTGGVEGVKGILRAATAPFREIASRLGRAFVDGVTSGLKSAGELIKGAANWLKNKIVDTIKSVFGIHSPSTVMAGLGLQLAKGLLHGFMGVDVVGFVKDQIGKIASAGADFIGSPGGAISGPGLPGGGNARNQRIGRAMLKSFGWGNDQWPALRSLWMGESGWSTTARNESSGAYGIPQSLPASKMASAGPDWRTNPATQIRWGLGYIKGRYGSPAAAYSAWLSRSPHWYAAGTSGAAPGWAWVGERGPELVKFTGGEAVLSHARSMMAAMDGYAKGTKGPPKGPKLAPKPKHKRRGPPNISRGSGDISPGGRRGPGRIVNPGLIFGPNPPRFFPPTRGIVAPPAAEPPLGDTGGGGGGDVGGGGGGGIVTDPALMTALDQLTDAVSSWKIGPLVNIADAHIGTMTDAFSFADRLAFNISIRRA